MERQCQGVVARVLARTDLNVSSGTRGWPVGAGRPAVSPLEAVRMSGAFAIVEKEPFAAAVPTPLPPKEYFSWCCRFPEGVSNSTHGRTKIPSFPRSISQHRLTLRGRRWDTAHHHWHDNPHVDMNVRPLNQAQHTSMADGCIRASQ